VVNAIDVHFDYIDVRSCDCLQYYHNVCQQHFSFLFIKAIVQHIVCFEYMLNHGCCAKKLSPYSFA